MFKFLIGFLILFAGSNFSCFASGVDDFNKKRFDSAFRALWPDAEAGQASAMFYIGRIYMEGLGSAPKDTSKGMSYITRSADKGFEPAIKIVAQSAERSGNLKVALNYYEKLKDRGDISSIEKIAEINEKLFGKDRELTASYCNSLESSKILNKSFNEFRYAECITSGKLSGRNIADAVLIYKKLAESGDLQSLQALIPLLVSKQNSGTWDPVYADNLIFKNTGNSKFTQDLSALLKNSEVNFESCRFTPPGTTFATQNLRASLCRLVALGGDQNAIAYVAERHLNGKDFFVRDLNKANFFIDKISNISSKNILKLKVLESLNNHKEHFELLVGNLDMKPEAFDEAINYQLNNIISRGLNVYPSELMSKSEFIKNRANCKAQISLNNFISKIYIKSSALTSDEFENLKKWEPSSDCLTASDASSTPSLINSSLSDKPSSISSVAINPSVQSPPSVPSISPKSEGATVEFGKLVENCDNKIVSGCLASAEMVITKKALLEITDESLRRQMALDLLEKANVLGSQDARYRIYDLLAAVKFPSFLSPAEIQKEKSIVAELSKSSADSATIRFIRDSTLAINPVANIFNSLSGKSKEYCSKAIVLSAKSTHSDVEKVYLSEITNSPNCKGSVQ